MEKIFHYQAKDQKAFEKCLRRIDAALAEKGDSHFAFLSAHPEILENESTYLLMENGRVKSFLSLSDDILPACFPNSRKSSLLYDLYDEIGIQDERVILLSFFGSDPADWGQGCMSRLFAFLNNTFKNVSWLCLVPMENEKAAHFLRKRGYRNAMPSSPFEGADGKKRYLFVSKLRRKGLASVPF